MKKLALDMICEDIQIEDKRQLDDIKDIAILIKRKNESENGDTIRHIGKDNETYEEDRRLGEYYTIFNMTVSHLDNKKRTWTGVRISTVY